MDTTNCPSGWATDRWILDHSLTQPCGVPVAVFYVVFALFLVLKTYILYHTWQFWLKRYREMKKNKGALAQRHPIVPTLLTLIALQYVLMISLVGGNAASVQNGGGTALYAISSTIWGIYTLFHVKKYVSLGRKLIPLAHAQYRGDGSNSDSDPNDAQRKGAAGALTAAAENRLTILSKIDVPLRALMSMMVVTALLEFGFGFIGQLVEPSDHRWMRVLFGLVGGYSFFLYISLMWHLERLVSATRICGSSMPASTNGGRKLLRAIRIMRISQLVWFVSGNVSFLAHLLVAVSVSDPSWIYVLCMLLIETLASTFAFLSTKTRTKKSTVASEKTTSNTNRENNTATQPNGGPVSTFQSSVLHGNNAYQTNVVTVHVSEAGA